jgi:PAS domain S-box-containing protein
VPVIGNPTYKELGQRIRLLEEASINGQQSEEALRERVKELNCLYSIADFIESTDSIEELLQKTTNQIPHGWYYPERACARITLKNQEFKTTNFQDTEWKISADIIVYGEPLGVVEVHYLEKMPDRDTGPFIKEEGSLINSIAERLGRVIERKRAEGKLRASEEQVRLLLNSTAEAIYGINLEGNCTFANPSCLRMLGYEDMVQLLGKNMHDLIHHSYPDGSPMAVEVCRIYQAFHEGKGMHIDDEVLWKADGSSFPVEYWSYPQRVDGEVTGAVVTFIDITKRRRLEEELKQSEKQYRLLIETLPLAVFVDTQGKIAYVNPAFLTLFKASSLDEVIGIRLIDFVSPELYDTIKKRRRIMTEEKRILRPLELNLRRMDGTFITVVSTPMPIIFQEQPATLSALYDVTDRKRREVELQKSHKLLEIQSKEIEDLRAQLKEQATRR